MLSINFHVGPSARRWGEVRLDAVTNCMESILQR